MNIIQRLATWFHVAANAHRAGVVAAALFFVGCATTGDPPTDEIRILRASAIARTSAQFSTYFVIRGKPSTKPIFISVAAVIEIAINEGRYEPAQLRAAIASLNLSKQTSADIAMGIDGALGLYQDFANHDSPPGVDRVTWFKPVATALLQGIQNGMDANATERHMKRMNIKAR